MISCLEEISKTEIELIQQNPLSDRLDVLKKQKDDFEVSSSTRNWFLITFYLKN